MNSPIPFIAQWAAWIADNEEGGTHPFKAESLEIARKLAASEGLSNGWGTLTRRGATPGGIVAMVQFALLGARTEVSRPTATDEAHLHGELLAAIEALRVVIARIPMPSSFAFGHDSRIGGAQAFHWRRRDVAGRFAIPDFTPNPAENLCLEDVLDYALEAAHISLPAMAARPRSVGRQRVRPEINAFLVNLAGAFERGFGEKMQGTLAHIASAVFEVEISKAQVVGVLRTR